MFGREFLPGKQVAHEVGGGDRFDFLSQTVERVTVNACEQTARAPFGFGSARRELSANYKAFSFEFQQAEFDVARGKSRRIGERLHSYWTQAFEASAQDLQRALLQRPRSL